jgi:hypothetical protein
MSGDALGVIVVGLVFAVLARLSDSPAGPGRYTVMASRATRLRKWLAQLLDFVLLHGPRLP